MAKWAQTPLFSLPLIIYPSTTSQSVFPLAAQRFEVTGVCILRLSCEGKRRTPLCSESERVLEQSGHSTNATPLSANRLRSMETCKFWNSMSGNSIIKWAAKQAIGCRNGFAPCQKIALSALLAVPGFL